MHFQVNSAPQPETGGPKSTAIHDSPNLAQGARGTGRERGPQLNYKLIRRARVRQRAWPELGCGWCDLRSAALVVRGADVQFTDSASWCSMCRFRGVDLQPASRGVRSVNCRALDVERVWRRAECAAKVAFSEF